MEKPTSVNILGKMYQITYVDKPSEVDLYKRESLWGQIDYWTRTIRIYDNKSPIENTIHTLFHEILHAIVEELKLKKWNDKDEGHNDMDVVALALTDVLMRNGWLK